MNKYVAQTLSRIKSEGRYEYISLLKNYEFRPLSECEELQKELLFNILNYSINNVPFYMKFAAEENINLTTENVYDFIKKFPILTKENLMINFEELKSKSFSGKSYLNTSGGSTGTPVTFLQDTSCKEKEKGYKIFTYEWAGRKDGEKVLKLWGSERDILRGSQGVEGWINRNILNIKTLNSFCMSEQDMQRYVSIINKNKPKIIEAYVQSIYELSKFIKNNNIMIYSPKGIITSAGTLYPEYQQLIEDVFRTKVYNRYGSREVGDIACSCEKNEGLHLNIFNQYVEILDDKLEQCKSGEIGHVYITTLNNYVMPLIRYQIGDLAVPAKNVSCSCGRGFPLIEKVVGRQMDVFKTKEGRIIPGEFFIHFIGVVYNKDFISKFQVIQKDYEHIVIKLVVKDSIKFNSYKQLIVDSIKNVMGQDCKVEFEFVDNIEPTKSGKYFYTISELK